MDEDVEPLRSVGPFGALRAEAAGLAVLIAIGVLVVGVLWFWQRPGTAPSPGEATPLLDGPTLVAATVVVHVTGAVVNPGVVTTRDGARVVDVLALAGGATADGDLGALNLARLVVDGEQIVVPRRGAAASGTSAANLLGPWDTEGRLNLNLATAADLEELPGVGPVLAQRIIDHREANGPFRATGDLRAVAGIGEKTFQAMAGMVVV